MTYTSEQGKDPRAEFPNAFILEYKKSCVCVLVSSSSKAFLDLFLKYVSANLEFKAPECESQHQDTFT